MKNRVGRPATGHKPRLSIRMEPEMLRKATQQARAEGKTVGTWLEDAIQEKLGRDEGRDG